MFKCSYKGCDKTFKRKCHLTRHSKNHDTVKYQCTWPKCNRNFFRKDLLRVHLSRHQRNSFISGSYTHNEIDNQKDMVLFDRRSNESFDNNCLIVPFFPHSHSATQKKEATDDDFYSWLFNNDFEDLYMKDTDNEYFKFDELSCDSDLLVRKYIYCDMDIRNRLLSGFDNTSDLMLLTCEDIELSLVNYWNDFHEDYPILHKPTFDSEMAPTLLLLSMVVTGLEIASRRDSDSKRTKFFRSASIEIGRPLRWQLHSNKDAQPPALIYIIQALLILLVFEMYHSTREFHERAHTYHTVTYHLIQRTPFNVSGLVYQDEKTKNGNIWFKSDIIDEDPIIMNDWYSWIHFESLKRTLLFAFYLDSTFSLFGHQLLFQADRMFVDLPCSRQKWEAKDPRLSLKLKNESISYLSALRSAIQGESVKFCPDEFNLKLILSGIINIANQLDNYICRASFLSSQLKIKENWKDKVSLAIDKWRFDLCEAYTQKSVNQRRFEHIFHNASHFTLSIHIYDLLSYSGAPWCMPISDPSIGFKDSVRTIVGWVRTQSARLVVIHAFMFLWETLLPPLEIEDDDFQKLNLLTNSSSSMGSSTLLLSTLIIWSYAFALHGPEAIKSGDVNISEGGLEYLHRIRKELSDLSNIKLNEHPKLNGRDYKVAVEKLSSCLLLLKNIHHLAGLCLSVSQILTTFPWEMSKENSNLVFHLFKRSLGYKEVFCREMYNIEREQA